MRRICGAVTEGDFPLACSVGAVGPRRERLRARTQIHMPKPAAMSTMGIPTPSPTSRASLLVFEFGEGPGIADPSGETQTVEVVWIVTAISKCYSDVLDLEAEMTSTGSRSQGRRKNTCNRIEAATVSKSRHLLCGCVDKVPIAPDDDTAVLVTSVSCVVVEDGPDVKLLPVEVVVGVSEVVVAGLYQLIAPGCVNPFCMQFDA